MMLFLRWILTLLCAMIIGKIMTKIRMPAILGWLLAGMLLGTNAANLMPKEVLNAQWYKILLMVMQCGVGLMLGTELIWRKLKKSGRALLITTLTQSLGTFFIVSFVFGLVFAIQNIPLYLAFIFGGIALATAPAPALSIVREFHTEGPVTDTLLPMAVLDDIVGIGVFFTVNAMVARQVSAGAVSLLMVPVMIFVPIIIGVVCGVPIGWALKKIHGNVLTLVILIAGICLTTAIGALINVKLFPSVNLNYMLMGVSFSAAFTNMVKEERLNDIVGIFNPVLGICLLAAIVDLGAPLDYHLIIGAGAYTFIYIFSRAFGKYFGARTGAKLTHMPETVKKYLGLTLLPHSGVSLVFTGIACSTLAAEPGLVMIVQGTIAAAAVINEIIAVIAAKKRFQLAKEIRK